MWTGVDELVVSGLNAMVREHFPPMCEAKGYRAVLALVARADGDGVDFQVWCASGPFHDPGAAADVASCLRGLAAQYDRVARGETVVQQGGGSC
jgi:hypothetical protein